MSDTILRLPAAIKRVGYSRSTIYELIKQEKFPKPISLGARAVGFLESEISAWIESRIAQSRNKQTSQQSA